MPDQVVISRQDISTGAHVLGGAAVIMRVVKSDGVKTKLGNTNEKKKNYRFSHALHENALLPPSTREKFTSPI